jgi:UDP-GlcNAc3NAcA epimerase
LTNLRLLTVVGARPQFIKAAALSRAILKDHRLTEVLVHTGQHYDDSMADVFFRELDIPQPDHNLGISGGSQANMTARMLMALEPLMADYRPDAVLVYGDTNSTLSGALAAAKLHVPVCHVEAGLRSFNRLMAEEVNRVLTDHLSQLLFCPTTTAIANLAAEGIVKGVHNVGDVMFDVTLLAREATGATTSIIDEIGLKPGPYAVATLHRAENTDNDMCLKRLLDYLRSEASERQIVFPVHPRTRIAVSKAGLNFDGLIACEPMGYLDMVRLLKGADLVYTDSGGVQKEAYFHRVPCVTLRDETEWGETIAAGWNRLWTVSGYAPRCDIDEYGEGNAAEKIIEILVQTEFRERTMNRSGVRAGNRGTMADDFD